MSTWSKKPRFLRKIHRYPGWYIHVYLYRPLSQECLVFGLNQCDKCRNKCVVLGKLKKHLWWVHEARNQGSQKLFLGNSISMYTFHMYVLLILSFEVISTFFTFHPWCFIVKIPWGHLWPVSIIFMVQSSILGPGWFMYTADVGFQTLFSFKYIRAFFTFD